MAQGAAAGVYLLALMESEALDSLMAVPTGPQHRLCFSAVCRIVHPPASFTPPPAVPAAPYHHLVTKCMTLQLLHLDA